MLHDEQHLVMGIGKRRLRREDLVEAQIIGIGHVPLEGHLRAFLFGIVGCSGHVTAPLTWYSGASQARVSRISFRTAAACATSAKLR